MLYMSIYLSIDFPGGFNIFFLHAHVILIILEKFRVNSKVLRSFVCNNSRHGSVFTHVDKSLRRI